MKMSPLTQLQVAVKNNVDVFYFSMDVPMHVLFSEEGKMGKKILSFHSTFPPLSPLYPSFSLLHLFLSLSSSSFCSLTPSCPPPILTPLPLLYSLSVLHCPSRTEYCSVLHSPSDRKVFLATWKEIPPSNEVQTSIDNISLGAGMQWNIRTRDANSFVPCREVVPILEVK